MATIAGLAISTQARAQSANVRFESDPPGLVLYRPTDTVVVVPVRRGSRLAEVYQRLCVAPCSVTLSPGPEELALAEPGGLPSSAQTVIVPPGSSVVAAHYESRADFRIGGVALVAASLVTGVALVATSERHHQECSAPLPPLPPNCMTVPTMDAGSVVAGMAIGLLGTTAGVLLIMTPDVPTFAVHRSATQQGRTLGFALSTPL